MHFLPKLAHLCKAKVANNGQIGQKLSKIIQKFTKDWCGQQLTTIIDNLAMD